MNRIKAIIWFCWKRRPRLVFPKKEGAGFMWNLAKRKFNIK